MHHNRSLGPLASLACAFIALSCSSSASPTEAPSGAEDASADAELDSSGPVDASEDVDKSSTCAATFGSALTNAFGRVDGTVVAVVPPDDQTCAMPNSTHLVVQVLVQGAVYRMVVDVLSDVLSDAGSPNVFFYETDAPLAAGAWAEGWHPGVALDYVATMSLHSTQFTSMTEDDVVAKITSEIQIGAHIAVFATSAGEPSSAHLVHRNLTNQDGAIVVSPEAAPHYLLTRFSEQAF